MSNFQFYESKVFSSILHLMAIVQMMYALHFDFNLNIPNHSGVPRMLREGYGGRARFLTYWCLVRILLLINQKNSNVIKFLINQNLKYVYSFD
jgi:hypothetical protein